MVRGYPVSVISGGRGNGRTGDFDLDRSLITLGRSALLTGLAALALLRKVGCNPNSVEEVHDTGKTGQEEKVEEDTENS